MDDIHVMPQVDIIEHIESPKCPCQPYQDADNAKDVACGDAEAIVWVHNIMKFSIN